MTPIKFRICLVFNFKLSFVCFLSGTNCVFDNNVILFNSSQLDSTNLISELSSSSSQVWKLGSSLTHVELAIMLELNQGESRGYGDRQWPK